MSRSRVTSRKRRMSFASKAIDRLINRLASGHHTHKKIGESKLYMASHKDKIILGASDVADYFVSTIIDERNHLKIDTNRKKFSIYSNKKEWNDFRPNLDDLRILDLGDESYFFDDEALSYVNINIHSTHISVNIVGDKTFIDEIGKRFEDNFDFVKNEIEWIYSSDGNSIDIPLQNERMPVDEMYPFLGDKSLEKYYDDFMKSTASILLLIGPPGTGKTTFIRGMLQHTSSSATLTYDANILEKDYVFASFVEGEKNVLILEDADMFLKSRKEGNTMMHKFLNVGDGLVTTRGKKMIFSTNLPSIKDIDPALIRPGRCYDILHFDELNQEQAEKLAKRVGVELTKKRSKWSVADVFFNKSNNEVKTKETKIGFV